MVILLVLLVICISSLFAFGIISYGTQCSQVRMTLHDNMLDTMLVISCLGITILITIWSFIVYGVYKNRKFTLRSENRNTEPNHDLKRDAYCETQHKNVHLRQVAANSSSEVPGVNMRSRDGRKKSQYNMLERPLTTRFSHSCDVRNDCYSTVNEETLIELKLRDAYEHESRSVPNLTDPSYTHIAKRNSQSISTVPDVVFRSKSENTTDDYDVLSQQSINFQDTTNSSRFHSCYEDISEASIEPLGAGLYLHLHHGEKSTPVPNVDDPTYSHVNIEPKVEEPQVKPKKFYLKKTGQ
ncbi:uncharacterized protein LOC135351581 [Halichondria panicea]|uniref:uncharacterized protein LOC135351581 n=1 Tax=Halichondria panicea TaxID=6063 RepID=UPI00312B52CF